MKEVPILFNGDMVRAILSGEKTQTRRPMKDHVSWIGGWGDSSDHMSEAWNCGVYSKQSLKSGFCDDSFGGVNDGCIVFKKSPFGKVGDTLWVRETFGICPDYNEYRYKADCGMDRQAVGGKWTPSIHMPRKACRIKLRVKRVWVERVQDIDEDGAKAEGCQDFMERFGVPKSGSITWYAHYQFCLLWDSIYGTWSDNPWVWCCEFEVIDNDKESK